MMRLMPFEDVFCAIGSSHSIIANSCRNPGEIYHFFDSLFWRTFLHCMNGKEPCYSLYYWTLFAFSLCGLMHSTCVLLCNIFRSKPKTSTTWYDNKFHLLTPNASRRLSLITVFISMKCWIMLLYAVLIVSPQYMLPWLVIHATVFASHLCLCALEAIMGRLWRKLFYTIVSKVIYLLTIVLVYQSWITFHVALEKNNPDKLMLWSQSI